MGICIYMRDAWLYGDPGTSDLWKTDSGMIVNDPCLRTDEAASLTAKTRRFFSYILEKPLTLLLN